MDGGREGDGQPGDRVLIKMLFVALVGVPVRCRLWAGQASLELNASPQPCPVLGHDHCRRCLSSVHPFLAMPDLPITWPRKQNERLTRDERRDYLLLRKITVHMPNLQCGRRSQAKRGNSNRVLLAGNARDGGKNSQI